MKNLFRGAPWPASTIAIISILFTPAVGGIVAGINHRRMGFPERARKDYLLALAAFVIYAIYFGVAYSFTGPFKPPPIQWLLSPTLAILYLAVPPSSLLLIVPSLLIVWLLYYRQQRSVEFIRERSAEHPLPVWWQAYATAAILTIAVGLLLSGTVMVLASEAFWLLIEKFVDL